MSQSRESLPAVVDDLATIRANYYYLIGLMRDSMRKGSTFPDNCALRRDPPFKDRIMVWVGGRGGGGVVVRDAIPEYRSFHFRRVSEDFEHLGETSIRQNRRGM